MKSLLLAALVGAIALAGCSDKMTTPEMERPGDDLAQLAAKGFNSTGGRAVIANRASGTISVIDAKTLEVEHFDLPAGDAQPEPMYVVHVRSHNRVFVGDRANDRVVVFDARSFAVETTVPAGAGVFHMWADPRGKQLWVNNDVDNTSTVIDPATLAVLATVPTPADLVDMGGKPHDVILHPKGIYAYVTLVGLAGDSDYLVQFDTETFAEIGREAVGKDPHLSLARQNNWLYVPCQNSDEVRVFDGQYLELETIIDVPGAHGAAMSRNGKYFYTSNLPGGGTDAIYTISTRTNAVVGSPVDSPFPVPHNLALGPNGKQLFVTHSGGASDVVSVYEMAGNDPTPVYVGAVTVGLNPFGLTYVE